jgi:hypothetical protein
MQQLHVHLSGLSSALALESSAVGSQAAREDIQKVAAALAKCHTDLEGCMTGLLEKGQDGQVCQVTDPVESHLRDLSLKLEQWSAAQQGEAAGSSAPCARSRIVGARYTAEQLSRATEVQIMGC